MASRARVWALVPLLLLAGCKDSVHGLDWVIRAESDDLASRIRYVEARIARGGCASNDDVYTAAFHVDGADPMLMRPPRLEPGIWGFAAVGFGEGCAIIGDGCIEVELPRSASADRVEVVLREIVGGGALCDADLCNDGECQEPDAGMPDAGMDAGPDDGGTDAGPDDGGVDAPRRDAARRDTGTTDASTECMPGETDTVPCGMCGTSMRTCQMDGTWMTGGCMGEGVCMPGSSAPITCGSAGTLMATCSAMCTLPATCPLDVMLLIDRTGSHNSLMDSNRMRIDSELIAPLLAAGDVRVGISYFADYPVSPFGATGDVPFGGQEPPTTDAMALSTALSALPSLGGMDQPESGIEALDVLAGGTPATDAVPFGCMAGLDDGGCWRPDAMRAVIIMTDVSQHNAPHPAISGGGLVVPYTAALMAPTWDDVRPRMMSTNLGLFAVVRDRGATTTEDGFSQLSLLAMDLGQDPTACIASHTLTTSGDLTPQLMAVKDFVLAYYGL